MSQLLEDRAIGDRSAYVVETTLKSGSGYDRIVTAIDKETCVTLRSDFFQAGRATPIKVLTAVPDAIAQVDGVWVAQDITMLDMRDKSRTRLQVDAFDATAVIPPEFALPELPDISAPPEELPTLDPKDVKPKLEF